MSKVSKLGPEDKQILGAVKYVEAEEFDLRGIEGMAQVEKRVTKRTCGSEVRPFVQP